MTPPAVLFWAAAGASDNVAATTASSRAAARPILTLHAMAIAAVPRVGGATEVAPRQPRSPKVALAQACAQHTLHSSQCSRWLTLPMMSTAGAAAAYSMPLMGPISGWNSTIGVACTDAVCWVRARQAQTSSV